MRTSAIPRGTSNGVIPVLMQAQSFIRGGAMVAPGEHRKLLDMDTDDLMALAKARAARPAILDERGAYFWVDEASSDVTDSYFTRMHASSLRNYAKDATAGIAFQASHDWSKLGLGWSLRGEFEKLDPPATDDGSQPSMRTLIALYTVPGIRLNSELSTDDFIAGVDAGILQDVSIGFYAGSVRCGICGGDMFNGWFGIAGKDCSHYPGLVYSDPFMDDKGNAYGGDVLATAWIHDARLSELSQVYDGATPGAGHLKALIMADQGGMDGRSIRDLERHYRVKLPGGAFSITRPETRGGPAETEETEEPMAGTKLRARRDGNEPVAPETDDPTKVVVDDDDENGTTPLDPSTIDADPAEDNEPAVVVDDEDEDAETPDADDIDADPATEDDDSRAVLRALRTEYAPHGIRFPLDIETTVRGLCETVMRYRDEAKLGRKFKTHLVDEALAEGVRAHGAAKFDKSKWRKRLAALDVSDIQEVIGEWRTLGNERFGKGRQTIDGEDAPGSDDDGTDGTGLVMIGEGTKRDRTYDSGRLQAKA